jgi:cytochrome c oxidase cbb3-type subunit III
MRVFFWAVTSVALCAQAPRSELEQGKALFRSNCAFCHGMAGQGGRGPNLTSGQSTHGRTPPDIKRIVAKGVPGSSMPSFRDMEEKELDRLVAFVLSLSQGVVSNEKPSGNPDRGRQVYAKQGCNSCHRIGMEGSAYGPELTRVGAGRSLAYLREAIVNPSGDVPPEWEGVEVVTADGAEVTGVRVNEDTFTVQLRDMGQQFRMYDKSELKAVKPLGRQSLMPTYAALPKDTLEDLLAYLYSLRGQTERDAATQQTRKGIQ